MDPTRNNTTPLKDSNSSTNTSTDTVVVRTTKGRSLTHEFDNVDPVNNSLSSERTQSFYILSPERRDGRIQIVDDTEKLKTRLEETINRIYNSLHDDKGVYKAIEKLIPIDEAIINDIISKVKESNNDYVTRLIRVARVISNVIANVIFVVGWIILVTSFLSLLTDPSPSLILLSVLKGVGLGLIVSQLGPIIPNMISHFFQWLEIKWIQYRYFNDLETDTKYKATLESLREWYKIKDKIDDYKRIIYEDLHYLRGFEKLIKNLDKELIDICHATENSLHTIENKLLLKKPFFIIENSKEKDEGGKQLKDYLENRSLYSFLTQKV